MSAQMILMMPTFRSAAHESPAFVVRNIRARREHDAGIDRAAVVHRLWPWNQWTTASTGAASDSIRGSTHRLAVCRFALVLVMKIGAPRPRAPSTKTFAAG